jgi:hypothetical protein
LGIVSLTGGKMASGKWLRENGFGQLPPASGNLPRIGRIVVARGRDAADVAISTYRAGGDGN